MLAVVREAVAGGARAVWLRDKRAAAGDRKRLAEDLAEMLHAVGGVLIASPGPGTRRGTAPTSERPTPSLAGSEGPVGRSCHSDEELSRASAEGCQWATLRPSTRRLRSPAMAQRWLGRSRRGTVADWALGGSTRRTQRDASSRERRG